MPHAVKRTLVWTFWIFLIYAVVTSPDNAAEILRTMWRIVVDGLSAILQFFHRLAG